MARSTACPCPGGINTSGRHAGGLSRRHVVVVAAVCSASLGRYLSAFAFKSARFHPVSDAILPFMNVFLPPY